MSSNNLKIIAIICMIIDHVGYYFYYTLSSNIYVICRIIGRVSMPIFAYLIVQGYFNTKSIRKYKLRLLACAIITQIAFLVLKYINLHYYNFYMIEIYNILNILFSLFLSLEIICLIDRKIFYANVFFIEILDKLVRLVFLIIIVFLYTKFEFDYLFLVPVIAICLYIFEKLRLYFDYDICNFKYKLILGCIMFGLLILSGFVVGELNFLSIFAIFIIIFYNGKLGKKNIFLRNLFYIIFPLHHTLLYFLAMFLYTKV